MTVENTRVPRMFLSQGLCIQSLFLLKSSETHMTSHELVSEGLVYGCSEIVNETAWLKFSQAESACILWIIVSTWPVSAVV